MAVLVDSPLWSLALRRRNARLDQHQQSLVNELASLIGRDRARMIGPVRQEVLSGIREEAQFERLRATLHPFADDQLTTADFERAAQLSNMCRRSGVIGSHVDFLICAVSIDRGWPVFTTDYDFAGYARVLPFRLHKPVHTA